MHLLINWVWVWRWSSWAEDGIGWYQLGPQQLKYMTVRRDSSACFSLSLLAALKAGESRHVEKRLQACFEEEEEQLAESLRDLMVESHFEPWSFMPWNILIAPWYNTLLMYLKLMPGFNSKHHNWSQPLFIYTHWKKKKVKNIYCRKSFCFLSCRNGGACWEILDLRSGIGKILCKPKSGAFYKTKCIEDKNMG